MTAVTIPTTRPERWQWLREQIAEWYTPLQADDGWDEASLNQAEKRLGVKLPAALREWYQLAGKRREIWSVQDLFLSPEELGITRNNDAETGDQFLSFYHENQCVVLWGIKVPDLSQEDPPVYLLDWRPDDSGNPPSEAPTISEFALAMFCYQLCIAGPDRYPSGFGFLDKPAVSAIRRLPTLFSAWNWLGNTTIHAYEGSYLFCTSDESLNSEIFMICREESLLKKFSNEMGFKWESICRDGLERE